MEFIRGGFMNKQKRERLKEAVGYLARASQIVDMVRDQEEDDMDSIPENMQDGDRYEKMSDAVDHMENAVDQIGGAIDEVKEAMR